MRLQPRANAVFLVLAGLACLCQVQAQNGCTAGSTGSCNSCVCCCTKGGIVTYEPDGCSCKAVYGRPFYSLIILALATIVTTMLSGWYYGGRGSLSPFPKLEALPEAARPYVV